jgi:hypothetical protein
MALGQGYDNQAQSQQLGMETLGSCAATRPTTALDEILKRQTDFNNRLSELVHIQGDQLQRISGYNPIHDVLTDKVEATAPTAPGAIEAIAEAHRKTAELIQALNACTDKFGEL